MHMYFHKSIQRLNSAMDDMYNTNRRKHFLLIQEIYNLLYICNRHKAYHLSRSMIMHSCKGTCFDGALQRMLNRANNWVFCVVTHHLETSSPSFDVMEAVRKRR